MNYLLSVLIFSPVVAILPLIFIKKDKEKVIKWLGFAGTLPPVFLTGLLVAKAFQDGAVSSFAENREWIQFGNGAYTIGYDLLIDGLSLALLSLSSLIFSLAALASWHIKKEWKGYFTLFLLLEIGTLGLFCADNFALFFLFFEVTFVTLFFLIGKWGDFEKERASFQFLLYNGLGSVLLLIVIGGLLAQTGTLNFHELEFLLLQNGGAGRSFLFLCLIIAFGIKLPVVPFHKWMVFVHKEAHPAVVMIHSGILLKIGAYGFIRIAMGLFPDEWTRWGQLLMILGLINLLYGASLAFIQKDLKGVWAYSSIAHMGFVLLGLAALNAPGVQGAIFQTVSHGFISAFLFLLILPLMDRTGTTELEKLGGLAKITPNWSGLLLVGGLAVLGLPGTSGFIGELTVLISTFEAEPIIAIFACLGLVFTAAYALRAVMKTTFGKVDQGQEPMVKTENGKNLYIWLPASLFLLLIIGLGLYPDALVEIIKGSVEKTMMGFGG